MAVKEPVEQALPEQNRRQRNRLDALQNRVRRREQPDIRQLFCRYVETTCLQAWPRSGACQAVFSDGRGLAEHRDRGSGYRKRHRNRPAGYPFWAILRIQACLPDHAIPSEPFESSWVSISPVPKRINYGLLFPTAFNEAALERPRQGRSCCHSSSHETASV